MKDKRLSYRAALRASRLEHEAAPWGDLRALLASVSAEVEPNKTRLRRARAQFRELVTLAQSCGHDESVPKSTERLLAAYGLLLELGRDGNNPTETELVLGCRDGARALQAAISEIREMRRIVDAHYKAEEMKDNAEREIIDENLKKESW